MTTTPFQIDPKLRRYPVRKGELLQAWDAADEILLAHVAASESVGKKILIIGDSFGALSLGIPGATSYTDSFLSAEAIRINGANEVRVVNRLEDLQGPYELVVVRVPKNLSFLEDSLARLSHHVVSGAKLVAGYMLKHQAKGAFDLIGKYFGETTTSLAKKKARLIFATFEREPSISKYPLAVPMLGFDSPFVNHSNVFSRERLDIGTRFLLEHIPTGPFSTILDLGCGNGVIGISAKKKNPLARVIFTDESRMALDSAEANFRMVFSSATDDATFRWTNGYAEGRPESVDLVLCNPPFHQGTTVGDFVAREMFEDAFRVLAPGGKLRVIGNTHLRYPLVLRSLFGNSEIVASNAKFQIVDALKSL
jgi:23S rRNA (guanine1835-N2)-methyltransferase